MSDDYYRLLGVDRRASQDALKRAFRDQVKHVHPDTHPDDLLAAEHTRQIVEAYKTLRNPATKRKYDSMLAPNAPLFRHSTVAPTWNPLIARIAVIVVFVVAGLLAAAIVGAFTNTGAPSRLAVLPSTYCPIRSARMPAIMEPLVWDSVEWYHAQRYQLTLADARAASELEEAYTRAIAQAEAAGDHARARFYAQAARAIQTVELEATAWPEFMRAGAR